MATEFRLKEDWCRLRDGIETRHDQFIKHWQEH